MAANKSRSKRKPAALDGEDLYAVEAILDKKVENDNEMYLVKWLGWSERWNSWEPRVNITTVELIDEFELGYDASAEPKRRMSNATALPYERKRHKKRGKKKLKQTSKSVRPVASERPIDVEPQPQSSSVITENCAETVVTVDEAIIIVTNDCAVQQQQQDEPSVTDDIAVQSQPQQQEQSCVMDDSGVEPQQEDEPCVTVESAVQQQQQQQQQQEQPCVTDGGAAVEEIVVCEEQNIIADNNSVAESLDSDVSVSSPQIRSPGIVPKTNEEYSDFNSQSSPECATNFDTNCDDNMSGVVDDSNRDDKINSAHVVLERLPTPVLNRLISKEAAVSDSSDNNNESPINDNNEVECEELIDDGVADYEDIDSPDNLVINEDYSSDEKPTHQPEINNGSNIIKSKTNKNAKTGDKANKKDDFVEIDSEEEFNDDSQDQSQESISMPSTPKWTPQSESIATTLSTLTANTGHHMDVINVNCNSKYETVLRLPSSPAVSVRALHPSSLSGAHTPMATPIRPPSEPRHAESIETTFSTIVDVMLNTSESDATHLNAVVHTLSSVQTPTSSAPLVITQSVPQNLALPSRLLPQPPSASMPSAAAQSLPTPPSALSPHDPLVADASRLPLLSQTSMRPYHQSFMSNKVARVNPMQDTNMYNNGNNNGNNGGNNSGMQSLSASDLRARAHIIAPHSVIMPTPLQAHPSTLVRSRLRESSHEFPSGLPPYSAPPMLRNQIEMGRHMAPPMHSMVNSNIRPDIAPIGSTRHLPPAPSAIARVERPSMMNNNQKYFNPRSEPLSQIQLKQTHRQMAHEHMQRHYAPIFMPPMRSVVTTTASALLPPSEPSIRTSQSSMSTLQPPLPPPQRYMNEAPTRHFHPYHHNDAPHGPYRSTQQYNALTANRLPWPFPVADAPFSAHNSVSQQQQPLPPRFYAANRESMIPTSTVVTAATNQGSVRNTLASNASHQQIPAIHTPYSQEYQKRVIVEPKNADNIRDKICHNYSPLIRDAARMPSNGVPYHSNNYTNQKNSAADKDNPALYNKMGHNDNQSNLESEVEKILAGKSLEGSGNSVSLSSNSETSAVYRNRDIDEAKARKQLQNSAFKSHILHQLLQPSLENSGGGGSPRANLDDTSFTSLAEKTQQQVMITNDSFNQSTDWPPLRTSRPSSRTPSVASSIGSSSVHHHKDLLEEALEQVQLFVVDEKDGYNDEDGEDIQLTITTDEEELKTDEQQQSVVMSEDGQCFYFIADENAAQLTGDALIDFINSQGLEVVDEESIKNTVDEEETTAEVSGEKVTTFAVVEDELTIEQTSNDSIINEVQIDNSSVQSSPQSITTDNLLKNCEQLSEAHINSANELNSAMEDQMNGDIIERQPDNEKNGEANPATTDTDVHKTDAVVADNDSSVTAVDTNTNELLPQSATVDTPVISNTSDTVNDNTKNNSSLNNSTKQLTTSAVNADNIANDDNNHNNNTNDKCLANDDNVDKNKCNITSDNDRENRAIGAQPIRYVSMPTFCFSETTPSNADASASVDVGVGVDCRKEDNVEQRSVNNDSKDDDNSGNSSDIEVIGVECGEQKEILLLDLKQKMSEPEMMDISPDVSGVEIVDYTLTINSKSVQHPLVSSSEDFLPNMPSAESRREDESVQQSSETKNNSSIDDNNTVDNNENGVVLNSAHSSTQPNESPITVVDNTDTTASNKSVTTVVVAQEKADNKSDDNSANISRMSTITILEKTMIVDDVTTDVTACDDVIVIDEVPNHNNNQISDKPKPIETEKIAAIMSTPSHSRNISNSKKPDNFGANFKDSSNRNKISGDITEAKKRGRKRKRITKLDRVSSTPPKKRMSDEEVRELLHLLRTRKNGFDYGWTPSEILGINSFDNTLIFLVKWSNDRESMVLAEVANTRCPQMVIQYYEKHVYWDEFDAD